ncbi:MAG: two-component system response regulator, partial [Nitrospirota bacterium]
MGIPLRVLIVEDSEDDKELVLRELRRGGYDPVFERVDTAEAMGMALNQQTWDIIISDYSMPNFNARAALEVLKAKALD